MLFNIDIELELYIIFIIFVILFIMIFYDRYKYNKIIISLHDTYDQRINTLKETINSINEKNEKNKEELNKQSIKYNQTFGDVDDLLNNIDNRITEQDQSLETIFDVILSINHQLTHHVQLFEENKKSLKNTNKTLDETTIQISEHTITLKNINKSLEDSNKLLEDSNNKISDHAKLLEDINYTISDHAKSIDDINNKISKYDESFEIINYDLKNINNDSDIIYPFRLLNYDGQIIHDNNKIHEDVNLDLNLFNHISKYNNKIVDIKSINNIKFKILYSSTDLIGLYVYINEIPFNTLGLSECIINHLYTFGKKLSRPSPNYQKEIYINDIITSIYRDIYNTESKIKLSDLSDHISEEYNIIYNTFEKIFNKSSINDVTIEICMCKSHLPLINVKDPYNGDQIEEMNQFEKKIKDTNKKLYNELITKICDLNKIKLTINMISICRQLTSKSTSFNRNINIITINNDNFEILYGTTKSNEIYIFKLDDILIKSLNHNNISNINFNIEINNSNVSSKMQEYIEKKLNSELLEKSIIKIKN